MVICADCHQFPGANTSGWAPTFDTGLLSWASCDSVSLAFHRNPSKDVDSVVGLLRGMGFVNRLENAKTLYLGGNPTLRLTEGQSRHFLVEMKTRKELIVTKTRLQQLTCGSKDPARSTEVGRLRYKNTRFLTWVPSKRAMSLQTRFDSSQMRGHEFHMRGAKTDASPVAGSEGMKNTHFRRRK